VNRAISSDFLRNIFLYKLFHLIIYVVKFPPEIGEKIKDEHIRENIQGDYPW